jgi:hypothetical protein
MKTSFTNAERGSDSAAFTIPGMYYRGDWCEIEDYSFQNCVTIRSGPYAGLYLAAINISAGSDAPGENANWIKIASLNSSPVFV